MQSLFSVTMSASGGSCCQQCSSTISKGQRFCANCGLRVDYDTAQGNLCTGNKDGKPCYNLISPAIRFCSSCGTENETYISDKTVTQTGLFLTLKFSTLSFYYIYSYNT